MSNTNITAIGFLMIIVLVCLFIGRRNTQNVTFLGLYFGIKPGMSPVTVNFIKICCLL